MKTSINLVKQQQQYDSHAWTYKISQTLRKKQTSINLNLRNERRLRGSLFRLYSDIERSLIRHHSENWSQLATMILQLIAAIKPSGQRVQCHSAFRSIQLSFVFWLFWGYLSALSFPFAFSSQLFFPWFWFLFVIFSVILIMYLSVCFSCFLFCSFTFRFSTPLF